MSTGQIATLSLIGVILLVGLTTGGCVISTMNQEADLRTDIERQNESNKASLDKMWKVIKSKAEISDHAVGEIKDMNKIYTDLVDGRSGGALFKMVTEAHPDLGQEEVTKLFMEVMASVEAERTSFLREQKQLLDYVGLRKALIRRPVSGMILSIFGNTDDVEYTIITSSDTDDMFDSGHEEHEPLFPKDDDAKTD